MSIYKVVDSDQLDGDLYSISSAVKEKLGYDVSVSEGLPIYKSSQDLINGVNSIKTAQEQYDEFWDNYQNYGKRTAYPYAFYNYWNDITYNPKYPIIIAGSSTSTFGYSGITDTKVDIIFRGETIQQTFYRCYELVTVKKIIFEDTVKTLTNVFRDCESLTNLTIEGTIAAPTVSLSYSPLLTHESIMCVINHLKDFSADTSGTTYTLGLGATNLAKLTDAEKAIATEKGWTLA